MDGARKFLFVCSQNKLRSPTAEVIFSGLDGIEALSAGTNNDAETPLCAELIEWADHVFAMERTHRKKIQAKFRQALNDKPLIVLDIPDDYEFMDPALVELLKARMRRWL